MDAQSLESSSSSNFFGNNINNLINSTESCLICGASTLERHFQVISCNACAAFFRRSIKTKCSYKCQRNHGRCNLEIRKIGKPHCRYCRLKKCFDVGMKADENFKALKNNFEVLEPATTNRKKFEIKPDSNIQSEKALEKINNIDATVTINKSMEKLPGMNAEKVLAEIKILLEKKPKYFHAFDSLNSTKQFSEALSKFIQKPKESLVPLTPLIKSDCHKKRATYIEKYLVNVAHLLLTIEQYANLQFEEKLELYRKFWQMFQIIEKSYLSYIVFGKNPDDLRHIVDGEHYVDLGRARNFTDHIPEISLFTSPLHYKTKMLLRQMKIASITIFEFAYICQIILWSCTEIDGLSMHTLKLSEDMLKKASDELHNYYVNEMHMNNYAARQAELIKLVKFTEFVYHDRRQLMAANQIFDFFEHVLRLNVLT